MAGRKVVQGTLELLILRTLLFGPLHGHGIAKHIQRTSEDVLQIEHGSLYPGLRRLEKSGCITSKWEPTDRGREMRMYRLTARGRHALTSEQSRWDELVRAMGRPSPFMLHGWLAAWCRHYVPDGDLRVHVVRDGEMLAGAFPLYLGRSHGLRVVRFLGGSQSALADLLLAPDAPADVENLLVTSALESGHDLADLFGLAGTGNLADRKSVV